MKCSCCGGSNLTKLTSLPSSDNYRGPKGREWPRYPLWSPQLPFVAEDFHIRNGEDGNNILICLDCGHFEFFDLAFVNEYKRRQAQNQEARKRISEIDNEIKALREKQFDPTPFKEKIAKLEAEIATLKSLGVNGKEVVWRQDEIKQNEKILEAGIAPDVLKRISELENQAAEQHYICNYTELK